MSDRSISSSSSSTGSNSSGTSSDAKSLRRSDKSRSSRSSSTRFDLSDLWSTCPSAKSLRRSDKSRSSSLSSTRYNSSGTASAAKSLRRSDKSRSSSRSSTRSNSSGTSSAVKPRIMSRSPSKSSHGSRRSRACKEDKILISEVSQMSVSKKRYTDKEQKQFAERHGDFIISIMSKQLRGKKLGPVQQQNNGKFIFKDVPKWKGGLYMFSLVSKNEENLELPIYVGQTMLSFYDRLKDKDLNHIFEWFDQDKFDLYVFVCDLTNPQASFMKAFFLDVFNFIRNSVGSDYKRKDLNYDKYYSKRESWKMVKGKWKDVIDGVKYVIDIVQDLGA